ncbi:MAG: hypothetical protein OXF41_03910 [bacterium]|nr:hypothetical protein [bacterium]
MNGQYWEGPVLRSVLDVVEGSNHVQTSRDAVERIAGWMAYEEFAFPRGGAAGEFDVGSNPDDIIDVTMLVSTLNFAFTDFATGRKFEADYKGQTWSDSLGMFACLHQALSQDVPLLDGDYLAAITRSDLDDIFRGSIEMPMLDERTEILNDVGTVLVDRYQGRFHHFVRSCAPAMYAGGDGLLERLVAEFPRFDDTSTYRGAEVHILKLAQLGLWTLHMALYPSGEWNLADLSMMTAFADYIVPVALEVMGIFEYTPDLAARIAGGVLIERDSDEEIEIRSHTLYATALLTDAINAIRPPDLQVVIPQVDFRLWSSYHATFRPHHLTRTVMY